MLLDDFSQGAHLDTFWVFRKSMLYLLWSFYLDPACYRLRSFWTVDNQPSGTKWTISTSS